MNKNVIKEIILRQQAFVSKVKLLPRAIELDENANYVLVGMRRAGKSYMLYQYIQTLLAKGHDAQEILFINFEDERISDIKKEELHLIIESYNELFSHEPFIFLDEIQNVTGWEHFARRLADEKRRVLITGSNARMLSREISSTLGGRYLTKEVHPFSFREFLAYRGVELGAHWELSPVKSDVVRNLAEYFYFGGLSESFDMQDKRSWLQSVYDKVFYSDIVVRKGVRNEQSLRLMVRKLADSIMQPMAVKRLQNILQGDGTKISRESVAAYLDYLNEAYMTFSISNFTDSIPERETIKKHYFLDNGILNLFLYQPETKLMENIVAIHLHKLYGDRLLFYNRNVEVDFCVPTEGLLVQVSYDVNNETTLARELTALQKTSRFLPSRRLMIVTYDQERSIACDGCTVEVVPLWKFLLEG